jgi:hypothetical protein
MDSCEIVSIRLSVCGIYETFEGISIVFSSGDMQ